MHSGDNSNHLRVLLVNRAWHEVVATVSSLLKQHELHTKEHSGPSFGNLNLVSPPQVWHHCKEDECWIWMFWWRLRLPKLGPGCSFVSTSCCLRRELPVATTSCQALLTQGDDLDWLYCAHHGFKHMVLSCRSWHENTLYNSSCHHIIMSSCHRVIMLTTDVFCIFCQRLGNCGNMCHIL